MLFINTAIALTFLPSILSAPAPASDRSPFRNDFEDEFAEDFSPDPKAPMGKGASSFDDKDGWESDRMDGVYKSRSTRKPFFDAHGLESHDEEDFGLGSVFDDKQRIGREDNFDEEDLNHEFGKEKEPTTYVVMVKTGDKFFSGTGAGAFLQFSDAEGNTVNSFIHGRFKRKSVKVFRISTYAKLGDVCSVTLAKDFSGRLFSHWFIEYVTIQRETEAWTFPFEEWIDKKTGQDGRPIITVNQCGSKFDFASDSVNDDKFAFNWQSKETGSTDEDGALNQDQGIFDDLDDEDILESGVDATISAPCTKSVLPTPLPDVSTPCTNSALPTPVPDVSTPCTKSVLPTPVPDVSTPCTKSVLPTPVPDVSTPCTKSLLPTPVPDVSTPCTKSVLPTPVPDVSTPCTKSVLPTPRPTSTPCTKSLLPSPESDWPAIPEDDDYPLVPEDYTPIPDSGYGSPYKPFPVYPDVEPTPTIPEDVYPDEEGYGTPTPTRRPRKKCRHKHTSTGFGTPYPEIPYGTPMPEIPYGEPYPEIPYGTPMPEIPYGEPYPEIPYGTPAPEVGYGTPSPIVTPVPEVPYGTPFPEIPYGTPESEVGYGTPSPVVTPVPEEPYGTPFPEIPYGTPESEVGYGTPSPVVTPVPEVPYGTPAPEVGYGAPSPLVPEVGNGAAPLQDIKDEDLDLDFDMWDEDLENDA